jgi:hypothetical protein
MEAMVFIETEERRHALLDFARPVLQTLRCTAATSQCKAQETDVQGYSTVEISF